jgi:ammonia channel protein AmtB
MLTWMLVDVARRRRPSALGACIGAVVGLVAITPAAGYVSVPQSIFIGFAASIVSNMAVHWNRRRRSTIRSTSFPATASAASSACCSPACWRATSV